MESLELIRFGTPALVLGILLFIERINTKITVIQDDIRSIERNITWHDTCLAIHEEVNRRLEALERGGRDGHSKGGTT